MLHTVGKKNRHCLCETCEKNGRGGYAPDHDDNEANVSDSSTDESGGSEDEGSNQADNHNLNERRTRRGVYAVGNKDEDASDESENEDENVLPLAGAPDIPAAIEIELAVEVGSELTPLTSSLPPSDASQPAASTSSELTPVSRSTSSLSSLSSSLSVPDDNSGSTSKGKPPTYRSVISTRRQKAQQEVAASSSAVSSRNVSVSFTPSTRTTRSSNVPNSPSKVKGKGRAVEPSNRSSVSTSTRSAKGKEKEGSVKVKQEEVEARVLRARPSLLSVHQPTDPKDLPSKPKNQDPPKGPDGKPLPLCKTCRNVLPVISVDSKVVWGLGMEKKKKLEQDCPRYVRPDFLEGIPFDFMSDLKVA